MVSTLVSLSTLDLHQTFTGDGAANIAAASLAHAPLLEAHGDLTRLTDPAG